MQFDKLKIFEHCLRTASREPDIKGQKHPKISPVFNNMLLQDPAELARMALDHAIKELDGQDFTCFLNQIPVQCNHLIMTNRLTVNPVGRLKAIQAFEGKAS